MKVSAHICVLMKIHSMPDHLDYFFSSGHTRCHQMISFVELQMFQSAWLVLGRSLNDHFGSLLVDFLVDRFVDLLKDVLTDL